MYNISIIFIFLFGLMIGSFLNCLIWRLHKGIPLTPFIKGAPNRSYCPKCRKQINWYDNIPIISFLILRGRCRECKKKISWQYPVIEIITGVLFLLAYFKNFSLLDPYYSINNYISLIRDWYIISVMIVIFVIDFRWYLILDKVTIPSVIIVFLLNLFLGFSWLNLVISGIIGGSFFLLQFVVSKGKWIGGGDIRMGVLMGFIFGWPNVLVALFLAYLIGSIIGIGLIVFGKKKWSSQIPFGTFLAFSSVIVLLLGSEILNWYISLIK